MAAYWHGCRKCYPENLFQYNKTQERKNILEAAGYDVVEVWECEFNRIKKSMKNRKQLEQQARDQSIVIRDAMFGGESEGFKSYHCCNADEKISSTLMLFHCILLSMLWILMQLALRGMSTMIMWISFFSIWSMTPVLVWLR
jgi:hypothetical protein